MPPGTPLGGGNGSAIPTLSARCPPCEARVSLKNPPDFNVAPFWPHHAVKLPPRKPLFSLCAGTIRPDEAASPQSSANSFFHKISKTQAFFCEKPNKIGSKTQGTGGGSDHLPSRENRTKKAWSKSTTVGTGFFLSILKKNQTKKTRCFKEKLKFSRKLKLPERLI